MNTQSTSIIGLWRRCHPWLVLVVVGLALIGTARPVAAQKSFYWDAFNVTLQVQDNGDLLVREDQTIVFSGEDFTFGFATINTAGTDGVDILGVREGDTVFQEGYAGDPYTYEIERNADDVTVYWNFPPTQGTHSYTFEYRVYNPLHVAEDGDELVWEVVPADFPGDVRQSTVVLELPDGVEAGSALALLNDQQDDRINITFSPDGRVTTFVSPALPIGTSFSVGVRLPHGQLAVQPAQWQQTEAVQQTRDAFSLLFLGLGILILIAGPLLVLITWYNRGRDPEVGLAADYLPEPPSALPPAVAGALIDEIVNDQDIMSTLVDLAHRGYLLMSEEQNDYTFTRTDKPLSEVRDYEQEFIEGIFGKQPTRQLSQLRYQFAERLDKIRSLIYGQLKQEGLVDNSPEVVRERYRTLAMAILFLSVLGLCGQSLAGGAATLLCLPLALAPAAILLFIIGPHMPRKTLKGAEEAAKWRAFRQYLKDIEKYRDLETSQEIFAQYLAYAVAFGLERKWIWKFSQVRDMTPPVWYGGRGWPRPMMPTSGQASRGLGEPWPGGVSSGAGQSGPSPAPAGPGGLEGLSRGLTGGLTGMSNSLTRMLNSTSSVLGSRRPASQTRPVSGGGFRSGGGASHSRSTSSRSFSGSFRSSGGGSHSGGGRRGFG